MNLTDIICGKVNELSSEESINLEKIVGRLQKAEPVQYVLGKADFAGRIFHIEPGVLIPRPETAELCKWITHEHRESQKQILDVCTGSGCIAITLGLDIRDSEVTGWDISADALRIAKNNTAMLGARNVVMEYKDALNLPNDQAKWDIIVSNPPYICEKEKAGMEKNVLEHEPSLALFVPDEDPLRFYRSIARYAARALKPEGKLYFEINPVYEGAMREMLEDEGFNNTQTKMDAFGKKRMMRAENKNNL